MPAASSTGSGSSATELAFRSALEQAELVRRGEVSSLELVELYLERIERIDPRLNSFVTLCHEEARAEARAPRPGPFSGVPLPIKDLDEVADVRTTLSTRAFADHVPAGDRGVVRRLRAAGFVVLGKTNTPELGLIPLTHSALNGICRNPWDLTRTPGGSSGGAAAAVAAGLAPAAQGSDGGGSIRIPASCCGLVGLKPTRGRVSPAPYGDVYGLSTAGPLTRTVADAAAILDAIAGNEPGDPHLCPPPARPFLAEAATDPGRLRVALALEPPLGVPLDPACERAAREAAALLDELGHEVEETEVPWRDDEALEWFLRLWQTIPTLYGEPALAQMEPLARELGARAYELSSAEYVQAVVRLQALARRTAGFCARFDAVLTPTLALPPVPVDWLDGVEPLAQFERNARFSPYTSIVNVAGLPAVSLPLSSTDDGLPVGVQLIGRAADEATLIRVSAQLETARPWRQRLPPAAGFQGAAPG
ncbi:MAG TPA: amidase [Gaiellaceae bacterium]|nr:amidase [Gaiellaceae bacterium]